GKVRIPGGRLIDAACAYEIPNGASVTREGDVMLNGAAVAHHDPCTSKQMGLEEPQVSNWVVDTWAWAATINGAAVFNSMTSVWYVPTNPTPGALLFFFPSFESNTNPGNPNTEIVQPVLQWGNNGSFGSSNGWSLASWYCSASQCPYSTPTTTVTGDMIQGSFYMAGGNTWSIFVQDYYTQNYSWLETNPTIGPFNTAQG